MRVLQRGQHVGDARKVQVEGGAVDVCLGAQVHDLDACHRLRAQQLQHRRLDDALRPAAALVGTLSHVFLLIDSETEGALPLLPVFPRYILTKPKQKGPALKGAFCAPWGSSSLQYCVFALTLLYPLYMITDGFVNTKNYFSQQVSIIFYFFHRIRLKRADTGRRLRASRPAAGVFCAGRVCGEDVFRGGRRFVHCRLWRFAAEGGVKQGSRKSQRSEIFGKEERQALRARRQAQRAVRHGALPRRVGGASDASLNCRFPSGASAKRRGRWPLARANSPRCARPV